MNERAPRANVWSAKKFRQMLTLKVVGLVAVVATTLVGGLVALLESGITISRSESTSQPIDHNSGSAAPGNSGSVNQGNSGPAAQGNAGPVNQGGAPAVQGNSGPVNQGGAPAVQGNSGPVNQGGVPGVQGNSGPVNQGGTGAVQGNSAPVSQGNQSRVTKSRSSRKNTQAGGKGNQQNNGGTFNNSNTTNNAAPDAPVKAGTARLTSVVSSDGKPGISPRVTATVQVTRLPNNGGHLFLVCNLLLTRGYPNLYYAKAELFAVGVQSVALRFGGSATNDPSIIGTVRTCGVVSADTTGAGELRFLMDRDENAVDRDPEGRYYDDRRAKLPAGCTFLAAPTPIKIVRLAD